MNRCPITYEECQDRRYSLEGLKKLSPKLRSLKDFPFSAEEQVREALSRAAKMSIQGVQPKLSVRLNAKKEIFEIVDKGGQYIFKPQTINYKEVPENEDVTMRLAKLIGIEVPLHGLVYSKDGTMTYFIRRFDRAGRNKKIPVEDFAQLSGKNRETKYDSSMEQVIAIIEKFCTFPAIEKLKLFNLTLFNYLIGNEDMHLKNFSVIRFDPKVELSPAYDLLNSTIILNSREELALSLNGKKNNLKKNDFFVYLAKKRLELTQISIDQTKSRIINALPRWIDLIRKCFLSDTMKMNYIGLLDERSNKLDLN
ncbi:MAG: HipA domain-containing protein [Deltaproteobacteria bacterium]|jgi:serine/threonine-protein kinase HipA